MSLAIGFEAYQLKVLRWIGLSPPLSEWDFGYLLLWLFAWYWAKRLCVPISHRLVDSAQRRLVASREPTTIEVLHAASSLKMDVGEFARQWELYFGRLGVNPQLLRPCDRVSDLGMRWVTYLSGDDQIDRSMTYFWRSNLTVAELFDLAQGVRLAAGARVAGSRIAARVGFEFAMFVVLMWCFARINPVRFVQQMSWESTPGVLTALSFEPYYTLGSKLSRAETQQIPRWTYRFSLGGQEFTGSSVAEFVGQLDERESVECMLQFSEANCPVVVLYDRDDVTRNAATLEHKLPETAFHYKVTYAEIWLVLALVSGYVVDMAAHRRAWRRQAKRRLETRAGSV